MTPDFSTWDRATLDQYATEAYRKVAEQAQRIERMRGLLARGQKLLSEWVQFYSRWNPGALPPAGTVAWLEDSDAARDA